MTEMTLYSNNLSPFASRVRIALAAKGLNAKIVTVIYGEGPAKLADISPMLKVPVLVHGDVKLPESEVICEYLEDLNLGRPLRPADPASRARIRLLSRIGDLYINGPTTSLFAHIDPAKRDAAKVEELLAELVKGLQWLGHYLDGSQYALGGQLSLADCTLVPILFFVEVQERLFGKSDLLMQAPSVAAYYAATQKDPHIAKVLEEMREMRKGFFGF